MKRSLLFLCLLSSIVLSVYPSEKVFASEDIKVIGSGEYTFSYPELKTTVFGERLSGKGAAIREIARNEYVAPTDAEVVFSPDKKEKFTFSHEKSGKAVDEEKLSDDISAALSVGGFVRRRRDDKPWI